MYVDVDGLKRVNDHLGHAAGDVLIVAAANVLRETFRETDVLARLGGDEFVAMAQLGHSGDERLDRQTILARFEAAIAAKRAELGDPYDFSLSCGTAVASTDELERIDDLLARTDREMYAAKRARRSQTGSAA
jgi:diguanylate cyclase (GGDEF)-like protein